MSTKAMRSAAVSSALGVALILGACGGSGDDDDGGGEEISDWTEAEGGTINALVVWGGTELENFEAVLEPFEAETGITVEVESTRDINATLNTRLAGGNPPDVAGLPGPGVMAQMARDGDLQPVPQVVLDVLDANYNEGVKADGTVDDEVVGIYSRVSVKGQIWYNPQALSSAGYEVPSDWDSLVSTVDDMASSGTPPWGIALESDAASGWPATDWIEDFVLRQSGPEVYDQWVNGELPWSSDEIKAAWEAFGAWATDPAYVDGGPNGVINTNFGNGGDCLFGDNPTCFFHHQASFMSGFFEDNNPDAAAGETYDFFPMPPIEHNGVVYAGDLFGMFNDSEQAQALMHYLVTPEAQQIWVEAGGGTISANQEVPLDAYPDETTRRLADSLVAAEVLRFDGSDKMPGAMNEAFFEGILGYVQNPGNLDSILGNLDSVQETAYES